MSTTDTSLDREIDIFRRTLERIRANLPSTWELELSALERSEVDGEIGLTASDGSRATLLVEVRKTLVPSAAARVSNQLRVMQRAFPGATYPIVIARYLPRATQNWLREANIAYADATGNMYISMPKPALFVRDIGATTDPWRGSGRPRSSLLGEPAARVVRALADYPAPFTIPTLVKLSRASTGATYRVVDYLEEQLLLEREERGPIENVQWRRLLEQWAVEYSFLESNQVGSFLEPRGIDAVIERLRQVEDLEYAVTGSWAARRWAPYAPTKSLMIYADDVAALVGRLGLRTTETGANVIIANSKYDVVYERAQSTDGVITTAASQTVVDLLTGPGRNPSEGQALLDWMERNESEWRTELPRKVVGAFWTS
jgi:hypothetical protein